MAKNVRDYLNERKLNNKLLFLSEEGICYCVQSVEGKKRGRFMRLLERFRLVAPEDPYVDIAYVVPWRGEIGEESFPAAGSHDRRCKLSEIAGHRHPTREELKQSEQIYEDMLRRQTIAGMDVELEAKAA